MSLESLPVELILSIVEHLELREQCVWARASHWFGRVLLGKRIYQRAHQFDRVSWPRYLSRTIVTDNFSAFVEILRRCNDVNNRKITRTDDASQWHGTLLHVACQFGRNKMVHELLEKGADSSLVDCLHHTPLHTAARYDRIEIAQILISRGASVSAEIGATSITALDYAVSHNSAKFVQLLFDHGASGNRPETVKHAAITYCKTGDPTMLLVLISAGVRPTAFQTRGGLTALCGAILHGHLWMAQRLVAAGVEPRSNRRFHLGIPSAHRLAALRGDHEMQLFLLMGSSLLRVTGENLSRGTRLITLL